MKENESTIKAIAAGFIKKNVTLFNINTGILDEGAIDTFIRKSIGNAIANTIDRLINIMLSPWPLSEGEGYKLLKDNVETTILTILQEPQHEDKVRAMYEVALKEAIERKASRDANKILNLPRHTQ